MGDCRTGKNGITLFFPTYVIFVRSFLVKFLGFEWRGFPCALECGFLGGLFGGFGGYFWFFFPHVLVSACAKNLGSNALLGFCLQLWGETDGSGIRNTSVSVLLFLKLLHHSAHKVSSLELLSKGLLVS